MTLHTLVERIGNTDRLDRVAAPLTQTVKRLIPPGPAKDILSGTHLGHPLHPPLTDIPIGSLAAATLIDMIGGRRAHGTVNALLAVGIAGSIPTLAAGAADWSDTYGPETRIGVIHAAANLASVGLFSASLLARLAGRRGTGRILSLLGFGTLSAGGYLGGHLTYTRGVGVNHAFDQHPPEEWTAVLDDSDLGVGSSTMVEAGGATILLHRSPERIWAIGSRCSHAGGPLQDGKIDTTEDGPCVQCPWHGSVFRLRDGTVVHGPASVPQAAYDVRIHDGRIEVRSRT